ncbi:MAG: hypothetical protein AAGC64_02570 [Bacteroidota bacterium]
MSISEIKLFNILKEKIGPDQAQSLVEYVEAKIESEFQDKQYVLATKVDLLEMRDEISSSLDQKLEGVYKKLEEVEKKLEEVEKKFEEVEKKFEGVEKMFEGVEKKFEGIHTRFEEVYKKFELQNDKINDLKVQLKSDKADILRWMFIFWVGQIGAILAILKLFFS